MGEVSVQVNASREPGTTPTWQCKAVGRRIQEPICSDMSQVRRCFRDYCKTCDSPWRSSVHSVIEGIIAANVAPAQRQSERAPAQDPQQRAADLISIPSTDKEASALLTHELPSNLQEQQAPVGTNKPPKLSQGEQARRLSIQTETHPVADSILNLNEKDLLYQAGESGEVAYRVLSGAVLLKTTYRDREVAFAVVQPNETFGDEVLTGSHRRHDAVALRFSELEVVVADRDSASDIQRDALRRLVLLEQLWCRDRSEDRVQFVLESYPTVRLNGPTLAALTSLRQETVSRIRVALKRTK